MRDTEIADFVRLMRESQELLAPTRPPHSTQSLTLAFMALSAYSLEQVRAAFLAHLRDPERGKFPPTPADIVHQIQAAGLGDGRPGAEEAWAIAIVAADESGSLVWTDEIAEAWGAARAVYGRGDKVGARMAFREAYERILRAARARGEPVRWTASLGSDAARRVEVAKSAAALGAPTDDIPRIGAGLGLAEVLAIGCSPAASDKPAQEGASDKPAPTQPPPEIAAKLAEARAALLAPRVDVGRDTRTEELKAQSRRLVADHAAQQP